MRERQLAVPRCGDLIAVAECDVARRHIQGPVHAETARPHQSPRQRTEHPEQAERTGR